MSFSHAFVTGGAGFIGSNLVDRLLAAGKRVTAFDNLSTGQNRFIEKARAHRDFKFVTGDVLNEGELNGAMAGADIVFHLSANADVRFGTNHPRRDLEQNTIATYNVLEGMRANGIKRIGFSSTGSIYGEPLIHPTPEDAPFPVQTSLYGASKLAGEGLIQAYAQGFGFTGYIFRFVSILGERYTHGHVFDFYRKLLDDPTQIEVLGNGQQRKSYLYVQDCIDAIFAVVEKASAPVNIYNLGADEYCNVTQSLGWICEHLGLNPERKFTGGERGWIGDSPFIFLDTKKVRGLGWQNKLSIKEGVLTTLKWLQANEWVFENRS